ncbi:MAG: FAD-binding oxidoreductase, partial [Bacteroidia bacterium]
MADNYKNIDNLSKVLEGELKYDPVTRAIYSTDASMYRETPLAVVWPGGKEDIR